MASAFHLPRVLSRKRIQDSQQTRQSGRTPSLCRKPSPQGQALRGRCLSRTPDVLSCNTHLWQVWWRRFCQCPPQGHLGCREQPAPDMGFSGTFHLRTEQGAWRSFGHVRPCVCPFPRETLRNWWSAEHDPRCPLLLWENPPSLQLRSQHFAFETQCPFQRPCSGPPPWPPHQVRPSADPSPQSTRPSTGSGLPGARCLHLCCSDSHRHVPPSTPFFLLLSLRLLGRSTGLLPMEANDSLISVPF